MRKEKNLMRITTEAFHAVLVDIEQYIPKLIRASNSVADILHEPSTNENGQILGQYLQGLSNLISSLLMTIEDAQDHAPSFVKQVVIPFQNVISKVDELEKYISSNKKMAAADIMKYELTSTLESLHLSIVEAI